jgi:DNA-binding transcriptional MerR regulator
VNDRVPANVPTLSIAAVERDTGLSKDTLRVWERRYGFPTPGRDPAGERAYTMAELEKLRLVKRLLDAGHRPGRIVQLSAQELLHLTQQTVDQPQRDSSAALDGAELLALIREHDTLALRAELLRLLARFGVARFVIEVVAPLNMVVGDAWLRGQLEVFEEHAYTEAVQTVLRQAIAAVPTPAPGPLSVEPAPRVLLSTFPGEPHGMGLLMVEAMMAVEGFHCTSLGVQTPLWDLVLAANAYRSDILALSFTACVNPNQIVEGLAELRAKLPPALQIWVGGSTPALHRRAVPGVRAFDTLEELQLQLLSRRKGPASP